MRGVLSRLWDMSGGKPGVKDPNALKIGILGAANIAPNALINPASKLSTCEVHGVAARNKKKAEKFAKRHKIPKVYESYEELINCDEIDIVFIPLPNGFHAFYTILALKAGKHVLCEKPLASNEDEVMQIKAALENAPLNKKTNSKPQLLEAFHHRFHPLTLKLRNMVENNDFGEIKSVECNFVIPWFAFGKKDIRYNANGKNPELAGGSLMDLGCYAVSCARLFAEGFLQADSGKDSLDYPNCLVSSASIKEMFKKENPTEKVDCAAKADLKFNFHDQEKSVDAKINVSFRAWGVSPTIKIIGTAKEAFVYNFIMPTIYHYVKMKDVKSGRSSTFKEYSDGKATYHYQLKTFIDAINGDNESQQLCAWAGGIEWSRQNMKIIDEIYEAAGAGPRKGKDCSQLLKEFL